MKLKHLLEQLGAWTIDESMEMNAVMDFEVRVTLIGNVSMPAKRVEFLVDEGVVLIAT